MANLHRPIMVEKERRRRRRISGASDEKSRGDKEPQRPTIHELRSLRTDLYTAGPPLRRTVVSPRMTSSSSSKSVVSRSRSKSISGSKHRKVLPHSSRNDVLPRKRKKSKSKQGDEPPVYVYGDPRSRTSPSDKRLKEIRILGREVESDDSDEKEESMSVISEEPRAKPREKKIRVVYVNRGAPRLSERSPHRHGDDEIEVSYGNEGKGSGKPHRSSTLSTNRHSTQSFGPLDILRRFINAVLHHQNHELTYTDRTLSGRDARTDERPSLRRSSTTASSIPTRSQHEGSKSGHSSSRPASFFGFFTSPVVKHQEAPRL